MLNHDDKLKLTDLIDIELLQELQDTFAKTMGVASIAVDDKGPITKPSNFTDFCIKYTRGTKEGYKRCNKCDIDWGKIAAESGKPVIYDCHSGLRDFAVPVVVEGKHIASILGGQILTQEPDEQHFRALAIELGINENEYIDALKKIKIVPTERVDAAANFLYLVANTISKVAHKNLELIRKNQREVLYRKITDAIRSSLDIEETLSFICEETAKNFNVQRASVSEFPDPNNYENHITRMEYKAVQGMKGLGELKHLLKVSEFFGNILHQGAVFAIDNILESDAPDYFKESYKFLGVKSLLAIPIQKQNDKWGILILSEYNDYRHWTDNEIEFAKSIASQIYIAIKHAELYRREKERTQREIILRNVISKIRSSLDIEEIKNEIATQIGKFLNADGVRIAYYDYELGDYIITKDSEYKSSDKFRSWVGVKFKNIPGFVDYITKIHLRGEDIIFNDLENYLDKENLRGTSVEKFYRHFGFTSSAAINIYHGDKYVGDFVVTFEYKKDFSEDEIEFLKTLADQAGTAFYQAELFKEEKERAQREIILRDITNKIRSSLELGEIRYKIVNEVGKLYKADRVTLGFYDEKTKNYITEKDAEYLSSDKIKTFLGVNFAEIKDFKEHVQQKHLDGKDIIFEDVDEYLKENNLVGTGVEDFYKEYGFNSSAVVNIYYGTKFWGNLVVTFENKRNFSKNDIDFLKAIADQAGVAFYQAERYEREKETAQRETLLRKIIEKIRSSLNINETLSFITEETAKLFNVQRTTVSEFPDPEDYEKVIVKMEYKSNSDIKGIDELKYLHQIAAYYGEQVIDKGKILAIDNVLESNTPDYFKEGNNLLGTKSILIIPIKKEAKKWGILLLADYNNIRHWTEEEVELANSIASQVYIAIYQAELFEKEKLTKEMEITLRETIKIIRSTLDTEKIKKSFLEIACNYFNADRCLFEEYDKETNTFLPLNIEIIKDDGVKSLVGVSVEDAFPEFAEKLKNKKRNIIIKDLQKTLARKSLHNYKSVQTLHNSDAKSDYGLLIQYQNEILGILILHYVKEKRVLTHEELDFLKTLKDQAGIALYQAELYEKSKKQAKIEILLREITERIRQSLNLDETLSFICDETAKLFNVQRVALTTFPNPENYEIFTVKKEYKKTEEMETFGFREESAKTAAYWANILIEGGGVFAVDNIEISETPNCFKKTYCSMGIKSVAGTAIRREKDVWGTLVLSEYNYYKHWTKEEKALLKMIADQIYIAINQAELFEQAQKKAANEKTLREVMLSSVKSFEIKDIIKSIVTEAGKLFKADRCFFIELDLETFTNEPIKEYAEYISSDGIISHTTHVPIKQETEIFIRQVNEKKIIYVTDLNKEELPEATKKMLMDLSVKSYLIAPIYFGDKLYGSLVLHYVQNFKEFSQDEIDMAAAIANQSAVVINKAELYEMTRIQTERERISKNIIEILRSTLDKNIVKKLFVKNIGKFLDADRVLFSEFNYEKNMYDPIDKDSEYLSDCNLNSFVGYDWSCEEAQEYIQPLLEKREFHIYNWEEYLSSNTRSQNFINLFERRSVKSSYSFPVMYQTKVIGFFSIAFIKQVRRLSNEDINRIRNICTQAGIALYHADLYEEAQKSVDAHADFVNKLSSELKEPLDMIIEFSGIKSEHELQCVEEIEHLNIINNNAQKLSYFLEDMKKKCKNNIRF